LVCDGILENDPTNEIFVQLLLFLKFGKVDVKIVNGKTKIKMSRGNKIVNEAPSNITMVTASWNTLSINNKGFTVTTHWRNQPYGKGLSKTRKRLIIEYPKNGYVRRGKGLKDVDTSEIKKVA
jgi:hypothetical protein